MSELAEVVVAPAPGLALLVHHDHVAGLGAAPHVPAEGQSRSTTWLENGTEGNKSSRQKGNNTGDRNLYLMRTPLRAARNMGSWMLCLEW